MRVLIGGFGMNGLQNEELTFNIAKKDDLFLHVKDFPGSHVVILEGKDNKKIRETAMELSLYLSHMDNGTVMIAKRKDVKKNPNKVFSREQLFERIWGIGYISDSATVTVHIGRIREKIEEDPQNPRIIETVWGAGYRLNMPESK